MSNTLERLKQKFKSRAEGEHVVGATQGSLDDPLSQRLLTLCLRLDPAAAQSTASERVSEAIKELSVLAQSVDLSAELEDLWQLVQPFAVANGPDATRYAALEFLRACILSQHISTELFRLSLFRTLVSDHWGRGDLDIRLRTLRELTKDGRDLREVEQEIGDKLSQWLDALASLSSPAGSATAKAQPSTLTPASSTSSAEPQATWYSQVDLASIRELLALVVNVVKFSSICLQESQIINLLTAACYIASRSSDPNLIRDVMLLLDAVVRYGTVPRAALSVVTRTLCFAVNMNDSSQAAWQIMRNLLKSHRARHTMSELFSIVDPPPDSPATAVLQVRGAVFIIAMANWGSQRVKSLSYSLRYLLPYLQRATELHAESVDTEILLSLQQLISENKDTFSVLDWEAVADVLAGMGGHWETEHNESTTSSVLASKTSALRPKRLFFELYNDVLGSLMRFNFAEQGGNLPSWFTRIFLRLGPWLSEPTVLAFIEKSCNVAYYATFKDWVAALWILTETFYVLDKRPTLRHKMLLLLLHRYTPASALEQEEIFDAVIVPLIKHITRKTDPVTFGQMMTFLLGIAENCAQKHLTSIVEALVQCALNTESDAIASVLMLAELLSAMKSAQSAVAVKPGTAGLSEAMSCRAAHALFTVFQMCANKRGGDGCLLIYKYLVRLPTFPTAPRPVRLACLKYLTGMRSDAEYRIFIPPHITAEIQDFELTADTPPLSPAVEGHAASASNLALNLKCFNKPRGDVDTALGGGKGGQKDSSAAITEIDTRSMCLMPIAQHSAALLLTLTREEDWEVYSCILQGLASQLSNLHFFQAAGPQLTVLRGVFCDMIVGERAAATVKNLPSTVRKSDIYLTALNILTTLLAYRQFFTKEDQDKMLLAFQTGLYRWPSAAKNCMHAFTLALLELPQNMTKLLPGTLLKVSQMMSTAMAVHNLEFLATLAHLPSLRVNFTDADLKRVFVIALQYINTTTPTSSTSSTPTTASSSALSVYIVQLAYQVLLAWFITLKLPERKKYVPFIIHYLLLESNRRSSVLDENVELVLDMLIHNSFADCWSKPADAPRGSLVDKSAKLPSRTWVQGNSLMTSQVSAQPGWINLTIRRPSGVVSLSVRLENRLKSIAAPVNQLEAPVAFEQVMRHRRSSAGKKPPNIDDAAPTMLRRRDSDSASHTQWRKHLRSTSLTSISSFQSDLPTNMDASRVKSEMSIASSPADSVVTDYFSEDVGSFPRRPRSSSISSALYPEGLDLMMATHSPRHERRDDGTVPQSPTPRQIKDSALSAIRARSDTQPIDPGFIFAQLITYPNLEFNEPSILLPEDDGILRGISVLDRTPVLDLQKIGVVYVGPNQKLESEILSNTHGSRMYGYFLQSLGRLVRLKGCRDIYTGGLDTSEDFDGRHAIYAQDDLSQIIFHVVTLMPTLSHDPLCTSKKRHIGNDFVTIVWNESGFDYAFDTIPAQFNFVNIIIEPAGGQRVGATDLSAPQATGSAGADSAATASSANASRERAQRGSEAFANQFFKVYTKHKSDMPEYGPLCEAKLVSGAALATLVRQSAVHANIFSQIFQRSGGGDAHTSNARERLRQIKRIRDRALSTVGGGGSAARAVPGEPVDERETRLDFTRFT
ncbi:Tuberous sclerosis 2-like protein [Geranomyces variabilis]|uniref:Tuberous sclerosis 2-like protein n=1 Tax=Geranomyces variabilis TaxID=109894 RepID=A0AAD5TQ47_9FUNG|nr:Tuberous sclerosis 2-like protein [Geranomyces variabilis]